ncbi:MAG TPA: Tm-1-like ATP-binding domain-containing protein, partial [Paracoccaceae bacterium]|nr:Tm-1-like ATP-binding domain-containing protein [Paracoccaceae bacterium]
PVPPRLAGRPTHDHNRLLTSTILTPDERREIAGVYAEKLATATGPSAFILPRAGCNEWDRPDGPLHDAEGLAAFCCAMEQAMPANTTLHSLDCHINDPGFCQKVLEIFDDWVARGIVIA